MAGVWARACGSRSGRNNEPGGMLAGLDVAADDAEAVPALNAQMITVDAESRLQAAASEALAKTWPIGGMLAVTDRRGSNDAERWDEAGRRVNTFGVRTERALRLG